MAVTLPQIHITFQQLAGSFIQRSERGIAALILRDDTEGTGESFFRYGDATQVSKSEFTAENQQYIKDALSFGPLRAAVVKIGSEGTLADALAVLTQKEQTGWITVCDGKSQDWTELTSWIKAREAEGRSWKAVCFNTTPPDSMHVVNFVNEKVTFADNRGEKTGEAYTPSLAGLLASCNVQRGATNVWCANLTDAAVPADPDTVVGEGKFVLIRVDDEVRVGVDVNSMTTVDGKTKTEDMKYIETMEAMDLMRDDIALTFRKDYLGQYRNSRANQMLFVSAVNEYLRQLSEENVLDPDHQNRADIDVSAQRNAWIGSGKAETADWTDDQVKAAPFKRTVYLSGDVKILGSMVNLEFVINLM